MKGEPRFLVSGESSAGWLHVVIEFLQQTVRYCLPIHSSLLLSQRHSTMRLLLVTLFLATCATVVAVNGPRQDSPVALAHPQTSTASNLRALQVGSFATPSRRLATKDGSRHVGRFETMGRKIGGRVGGVAGAIGGGALGAAGGAAAGAALGSAGLPIGTVAGGVAGGMAGAYFGGSAGLVTGKKAGTSMGGKIGRQFDKHRDKKNLKNFESTNPQNSARLTRRHSAKFLL
ncbi:hypothetical protein LEN26_011892 [Aphanomyces euteiches]|nr:hypothetical protein LEN26_011892 [Aphanomyces euteiches]